MQRTEESDAHKRFRELCALAQANELTAGEQLDLESHLHTCEQCRELYRLYSLIDKEGIPFLSANEKLPEAAQLWDSTAAWRRLFASTQDNQSAQKILTFKPRSDGELDKPLLRMMMGKGLSVGCIAAGVIALVALGAYHAGMHARVVPQQIISSSASTKGPLPIPTEASVQLLDSQATRIATLERRIEEEQKELVKLRAASSLAEEQMKTFAGTRDEKDEELRLKTAENNRLANQLIESEKGYQALQTELSNLKTEHDRSLLRVASLESRVMDLTSVNQDQQRRLKDDEQYLTSDRDIRELMGARKLYIADVFDVDSGSRTRKPFGRVFYTQNKSLVFYAFDLDHQPGIKNASAFQVWGQRDSESNTESHPMNLGILYMDSESNRRWVLRFDDPKQLAEIDAVFVTVEPHGGSQKPTGKPLLYALLRKEANHP